MNIHRFLGEHLASVSSDGSESVCLCLWHMSVACVHFTCLQYAGKRFLRTGGYGGGQGGYSSEEEDGQLASGDWEHVNKTWNRQ